MKEIKSQKALTAQINELVMKSIRTGEKLPTEKEMTERFGVSRALLRDVLSVYEASGVIVSRQGSGRYAQIPDIGAQIIGIWSIFIKENPTMLLNLLEIRSILEIYSLPNVISKISIDQLRDLNEQVNEMKRKVSLGQTFAENDKEFHKILFASTDNKLLEQLLSAFWDLYVDAQLSTYREDLHLLAAQHQEILDAIVRKDTDLATKLMQQQFEDAKYQIVTTLLER